jgi:hypothetical protein
MLTGQELGAAIEAARVKKGVTKKAMADHFEVSPPSIQDWVKRGTIDKGRLPDLWEFFKDVVGPAHWGLKNVTSGSQAYKAAGAGKPSVRNAMEPPPGVKLTARGFSLGSRLDALREEEHRRIAYALMANILDQYEALEAAADAPRPPTKSTPRAKRAPSRQNAR